jgi:3-oxoacyl-[acyl-carrier protein] reductase
MIDPQLQGRTVLITGANNPLGIGAATAQAFAREGAKVALTYLRLTPETWGIRREMAEAATEPGMPRYHALRMQDAESVVEHIGASGGVAAAREVDLTDSAQIPPLFDWVEQTLGPVDILVNNAAHYEDPDTIFTTTAEGLARTLAVNVQATVLLIAEYVRRYRERQGHTGRIINLSTDAAQLFPSQISYGASKATVEAFTRSIGYEVGPLGITVNTIAPGPVQTGYIPTEHAARLADEIPLRRIGEPADIADAILFLASHQARWITGQVLRVSGGHVM